MTRQLQPNPVPGPAVPPASKRQAQGEIEASLGAAVRGPVKEVPCRSML
jgi:hypothetical protein